MGRTIPLEITDHWSLVENVRWTWNDEANSFDAQISIAGGESVYLSLIDRVLLKGRWDVDAHKGKLYPINMAVVPRMVIHSALYLAKVGEGDEEQLVVIDDDAYRHYRYTLGGVGFGDIESANRRPLRSRLRRRR